MRYVVTQVMVFAASDGTLHREQEVALRYQAKLDLAALLGPPSSARGREIETNVEDWILDNGQELWEILSTIHGRRTD